MQNIKKERQTKILIITISVVIHFCFFVLLDNFQIASYIDVTEVQNKKFEVVLDQDLVKKVIDNYKGKKQIVNNEYKNESEAPIKSRFFGEKNQKYDREVTSIKIDSFNTAGKGVKTAHHEKQIKTNHSVKNPITNRKALSLNDLAIAKSFNESKVAAKYENLGITIGDESKNGISSNNDYIEDIALGDVTNLNTTEFKFYGFYFRIRQRLEQFWGQSLQEKATHFARLGRRLPASSDKVTALKVILDKKGEILQVIVESTSGVKELDDAATESFRSAGPFPNPPAGMIRDGVVQLNWGFVVKL